MQAGACAIDRWLASVGDPTLLGWGIAIAYFAAIAPVLAARARTADEHDRMIWCIAALLLALFGLNKQLDLHTLVTALGRCYARQYGWIDHRRAVQGVFVALVFAATLIGLAVLVRLARGRIDRFLPVLAGLILVIGYGLLRAANFNHLAELFDGRSVWLIELGGILLVALGAGRVLLWPPEGHAGGDR